MKKLITYIIIFTLFVSFNNVNKKQGIGYYENTIHKCENHNHFSQTTLSYNPNDKVIIVGLGNVSREKLLVVEQTIKSYYKLTTEIIEKNEPIDNKFFFEGGSIINADMFVRSFYSQDRVIYITNNEMYSLDTYLRGYTTIEGKIVIIKDNAYFKETVIHELGHTYGLFHCDDLSCVMAIYNDGFNKGKLCNKCKSAINYK